MEKKKSLKIRKISRGAQQRCALYREKFSLKNENTYVVFPLESNSNLCLGFYALVIYIFCGSALLSPVGTCDIKFFLVLQLLKIIIIIYLFSLIHSSRIGNNYLFLTHYFPYIYIKKKGNFVIDDKKKITAFILFKKKIPFKFQ